MLLKRQKFAAY